MTQYESAIAPTLDQDGRARADVLFTELQARTSLQAPSSELEAVTAELRAALSDAVNGTTEAPETTTTP